VFERLPLAILVVTVNPAAMIQVDPEILQRQLREIGHQPDTNLFHPTTHAKAHRPDLKQLLFILTMTADSTTAHRAASPRTDQSVPSQPWSITSPSVRR
jgi:hypothetical protein